PRSASRKTIRVTVASTARPPDRRPEGHRRTGHHALAFVADRGETTMRLKGKIALISASASGIGRAAAVLFAREGAAVAVADIDKGRIGDTVAEIKGAGGRAHGIPCDLPREADSRRIVRETLDAFGALDILWNNVGH